MAIAWFIVPYKRRDHPRRIMRYCAMDDYTEQIVYDGGVWAETEVLGNRAIVKVRASNATLDFIDNIPGFRRLPKDRLGDSLKSLSTAVLTALRDELIDAGYTIEEIRARLGNNLGNFTLGDVLRFLATRRRDPRYNPIDDTIYCDGDVRACRSVDEVDADVSEA